MSRKYKHILKLPSLINSYLEMHWQKNSKRQYYFQKLHALKMMKNSARRSAPFSLHMLRLQQQWHLTSRRGKVRFDANVGCPFAALTWAMWEPAHETRTLDIQAFKCPTTALTLSDAALVIPLRMTNLLAWLDTLRSTIFMNYISDADRILCMKWPLLAQITP